MAIYARLVDNWFFMESMIFYSNCPNEQFLYELSTLCIEPNAERMFDLEKILIKNYLSIYFKADIIDTVSNIDLDV